MNVRCGTASGSPNTNDINGRMVQREDTALAWRPVSFLRMLAGSIPGQSIDIRKVAGYG